MSDEVFSPNRVRRFQAEKNDGQFGSCGRGLFKSVGAQIGESPDEISSNEDTYVRMVLSKHSIAFTQALFEKSPCLIKLAQSK